MRILITGGAGFVGSSLAIYLSTNMGGCEVIAFDNLKRRGSELNLIEFKKFGVKFIHGDIRNIEDFEGIPGVDLIIDCSAEPSVLAEQGAGVNYLVSTNLLGTLNCLNFARSCEANFIFLSSSRVYPILRINNLNYEELENRFELSVDNAEVGVSSLGFSEHLSTVGLRTLYGTTKLSSEYFINEYAELYGMDHIINRCGLIAGPGQFGKIDQGVITSWVSRHVWKQDISYFGYNGTGKQVRDVLNIKDLCEIIHVQIDKFSLLSGETFNLGGGPSNSVSLKELTDICRIVTGNSLPISQVTKERPGDLIYYATDYSKIEKLTQWRPKKTVEETVSEIHNWITKNEKDLKNVIG